MVAQCETLRSSESYRQFIEDPKRFSVLGSPVIARVVSRKIAEMGFVRDTIFPDLKRFKELLSSNPYDVEGLGTLVVVAPVHQFESNDGRDLSWRVPEILQELGHPDSKTVLLPFQTDESRDYTGFDYTVQGISPSGQIPDIYLPSLQEIMNKATTRM